MDPTKDPEDVLDNWICQVCGYKFTMKSKVCCPNCNSSFVELDTNTNTNRKEEHQ